VGDSAFQLYQHVMVPYKDTGSLTVHQLNFNRQLSQTRHVIENAFAFLKGRFRRLKKLECNLDRVPPNIIACCVLHNITTADEAEIQMLLHETEYGSVARRKRDNILQRHRCSTSKVSAQYCL